jgi:uncharacterized Tic20 family protein
MTEPTSDEKMFAAIAHASGAAVSFVGPLIIWFLKKDQSAYVAYHAIQAGIYHAAAFFLFSVLATCTFGLGFFLLPLFWLPSLFWAWKVYSSGTTDGYPGIAQFGRTEQLG